MANRVGQAFDKTFSSFSGGANLMLKAINASTGLVDSLRAQAIKHAGSGEVTKEDLETQRLGNGGAGRISVPTKRSVKATQVNRKAQ